MAAFSVQLPVSTILHGQSTVSNIGDVNKVGESCSENISGPAETLRGSWRFSTNLVEYSGNSEIECKDLKKHIVISSEPANILALEYAGAEVFLNCNNKEVNLA